MNGTTRPSEEMFAIAARCADCQDGACMKACPKQIDLRALFEFIAKQAPMPVTWMEKTDEAEAFVGEAIRKSFH